MNLITTLRSEMLKTKRTASFYFALFGALPVPIIFLLNLLTGGSDIEAIRNDSLNSMFAVGLERNGLLFFPVFVILVCTLLPQIEYRNNTWKQVFASPQTKWNVFLAKFLTINLLIIVFLLASLLFMLMVIVVTHFAHPTLHLLNQPFDAAGLLIRTANTYVTMLAVCAFQFWLGLRFRNFIVPTAVGFALWFTGMMLSFEFKSDLVNFFPYSFQTLPFIADFQSKMSQIALTSIGYATLFLLLAFLDFRRRRLTT
jgi:hypothetical protein